MILVLLFIIMMTACAAAYRATVGICARRLGLIQNGERERINRAVLSV